MAAVKTRSFSELCLACVCYSIDWASVPVEFCKISPKNKNKGPQSPRHPQKDPQSGPNYQKQIFSKGGERDQVHVFAIPCKNRAAELGALPLSRCSIAVGRGFWRPASPWPDASRSRGMARGSSQIEAVQMGASVNGKKVLNKNGVVGRHT